MGKQTGSSVGLKTNTLSKELEREPEVISRFVSEADRARMSYDYIIVDNQILRLDAELERLEKKYRRLKKEILREREAAAKRKEQLFLAFQTGMSQEPMQFSPSAHTNVMPEES